MVILPFEFPNQAEYPKCGTSSILSPSEIAQSKFNPAITFYCEAQNVSLSILKLKPIDKKTALT
ncbi:MAG: hypothetical protein ACI9DK_003275 [Vicingaceae bacterium]|jgi:hypothetical protein